MKKFLQWCELAKALPRYQRKEWIVCQMFLLEDQAEPNWYEFCKYIALYR